MISATSELSEMAYDESTEADRLLDKSEQLIFNISQKYTKIELIDISGGNGGTDYLTFEKN